MAVRLASRQRQWISQRTAIPPIGSAGISARPLLPFLRAVCAIISSRPQPHAPPRPKGIPSRESGPSSGSQHPLTFATVYGVVYTPYSCSSCHNSRDIHTSTGQSDSVPYCRVAAVRPRFNGSSCRPPGYRMLYPVAACFSVGAY